MLARQACVMEISYSFSLRISSIRKNRNSNKKIGACEMTSDVPKRMTKRSSQLNKSVNLICELRRKQEQPSQ